MSDAKKKILARRAQFVAAAMASLAVGACGKEDGPRPCLSPPPSYPDANAPPPMPCLSIAIPVEPPDAGPPDAGPPEATPPDAGSRTRQRGR